MSVCQNPPIKQILICLPAQSLPIEVSYVCLIFSLPLIIIHPEILSPADSYGFIHRTSPSSSPPIWDRPPTCYLPIFPRPECLAAVFFCQATCRMQLARHLCAKQHLNEPGYFKNAPRRLSGDYSRDNVTTWHEHVNEQTDAAEERSRRPTL